MRSLPRFTTSLVLGASLATLTACGSKDSEQNPAAAAASAGDTSSMAGATASGAMDSAAGAMATAPTAGGGTMDVSNLASMDAPDQMGLLGASNAAEILTSKAAQPKLSNANVKSFAREMITEHQAMQKQADQLATRLNITPKNPDRAVEKARMANEMAVQLKNASTAGGSAGAQSLDRQYIDGQVLAHQQTFNELQAMQGTQNAEVATLVKAALPKVQAHLERAKKLQAELGGANGGANNGVNNGAVSAPTAGAATGAASATGPGTQGSTSSTSRP